MKWNNPNILLFFLAPALIGLSLLQYQLSLRFEASIKEFLTKSNHEDDEASSKKLDINQNLITLLLDAAEERKVLRSKIEALEAKLAEPEAKKVSVSPIKAN